MSTELIKAIAAKALDGLQARQAATAQNIANANSENYSPLRVTFEDELRRTVTESQGMSTKALARQVAGLQPSLQLMPYGSAQTVRIDQEITTASETTARYAMLIGMLNRTLQIEQLAIKGG